MAWFISVNSPLERVCFPLETGTATSWLSTADPSNPETPRQIQIHLDVPWRTASCHVIIVIQIKFLTSQYSLSY